MYENQNLLLPVWCLQDNQINLVLTNNQLTLPLKTVAPWVESSATIKLGIGCMVHKKYTEEQIIAVLKESEAWAKTGELCHKYGMSVAKFYNWKAKYTRLTILEDENRRLKQIVAQQALDNWALKKLLSKNF